MLLTNGPSRLIGGGRVPWYRAGGAPQPVAAYCPKGAASLAASYVNLANPGTYNAAPGVAPTWNATTGWTFAAAAYLTTGINAAANMTVIVRFSALSGTTRAAMGSRGAGGGGTGLAIWPVGSPGTERYYDNGSRGVITNQLSSGVLAIAGSRAFRDGADEGITLANTATGPGMYLGALNNNGTMLAPLAGSIQAVAIYSATLTAAQVAAVSAAMAAL